ncbi:hypothetical protein WA026_005724, partial [Henosepilachna vigintioctopunctata]
AERPQTTDSRIRDERQLTYVNPTCLELIKVVNFASETNCRHYSSSPRPRGPSGAIRGAARERHALGDVGDAGKKGFCEMWTSCGSKGLNQHRTHPYKPPVRQTLELDIEIKLSHYKKISFITEMNQTFLNGSEQNWPLDSE